jgi:hypothetical protein
MEWGPFLQTLPDAAINSHNFSSFTIELSVFVARGSELDTGNICLLERPSAPPASCPSLQIALSPSNKVLVTWSNALNVTSAAASASQWKLAGRTSLEEKEWHRIVVIADASADGGRGACVLYLFRAQDGGWRQV